MLKLFNFFQPKSFNKVPNHIAIIMDGNARYAKKYGLPIKVGHKIGSENVKKIADNCIEFGVNYLTIFAFSSENWFRPQEEVKYLMELLYEYLSQESDELQKKGIKILVSGNLENVEEKIRKKILEVEECSKNNNKLTLIVAFSYGARQEIIDTTKKIAIAIKNNEYTIDQVDEKFFSQNLYHPEIPDPALLIRTAGELRISNFLLWQIAYTELYFSQKFWPEFNKKELSKAIYNFNLRDRRYGKRQN